jgi:hypothetical protein
MANPDYATLLPLIAAETDPDARQALIDQAYQFNEPLTPEEEDLFSYVPDGYVSDVDEDYDFFTSYVGNDYNAEGVSTLANLGPTQAVEVTGVTRSLGAPSEQFVSGQYNVQVTASEPLSINHRFDITLIMDIDGGDSAPGGSSTVLGTYQENLMLVNTSTQTFTCVVPEVDFDDIYSDTDLKIRATLSGFVVFQDIETPTGQDFVVTVGEFLTEYNPGTAIGLNSVTATSSTVQIQIRFDEEIKEDFKTRLKATAGSSNFELVNAHTVTAGTGTQIFSVTWGIPIGTNYYNTIGNFLEVEVMPMSTTQSATPVQAAGFEAIRFPSRNITSLVDTMPAALNSALSTFNGSTPFATVEAAIAGQGFQPIAAAGYDNIAENIGYVTDPLSSFGFVKAFWDNARTLGGSYGFLNLGLNGHPFYGIAAFNNTGYMGSAYMMFSPNQGNCTQPSTVPEMFTNLQAANDSAFPFIGGSDDYFTIRAYGTDRQDIQPDGTPYIFEDASDNLFWGFSNNQTPNADGYYATDNALSNDDGVWGFVSKGIVQGNMNAPSIGQIDYQNLGSLDAGFFMGNFQGGDSNLTVGWGQGMQNIGVNQIRFFIFVL